MLIHVLPNCERGCGSSLGQKRAPSDTEKEGKVGHTLAIDVVEEVP